MSLLESGTAIAGISGGTGVVTVAQVLGTAAMLDGFHVRGLDQTGLSQKAGPVVSDLYLGRPGHVGASNHLGIGQADPLVAFDSLVAAADEPWRSPMAATESPVMATSAASTSRSTCSKPARALARLLSGLDEIYRGVESGELRPILDSTYPLTRDGAVEAHRYIHARRNLGKVVLTN